MLRSKESVLVRRNIKHQGPEAEVSSEALGLLTVS